MKKWMAFMLVLFASLVLYGCHVDEPVINLEDSSYTLNVGDTKEIKFEIENDNDFTVLFESSNPEVFTIEDGKIVAKKAGEATLKLTIEGKTNVKAEATVKVEAAATPTFKLDKESYVVNVDQNVAITTTTTNLSGYKVVLESSNEDVFIVVDDKEIRGVGEGEATLTARVEGHEDLVDQANVKVTIDTTIREINFEDETPEVYVGETLQLEFYVVPASASKDVTWESADTSVLTIDENGLVTAHAEGTSVVTVKSVENTRVTKSILVYVIREIEYEDPTEIVLDAPYSQFAPGNELAITAKVLPEKSEDGDGANQAVTWESADESIATVGTNGRVLGIAEGTTVIIARSVQDPTIFAEFEVTVREIPDGEVVTDPTHITIEGPTTIEQGTRTRFTSTVYPIGVSQNVTWISYNEDIATVSQTGHIVALQPGTAIIQVQSNVDFSILRVIEITVTPEIPEPPVNDMQGYTIQIMHAPHVPHEHDPYHVEYPGQDKNEKIAAWEAVELKYNVVLETVPYPDTAPWGRPRIDWIVQNAAASDAQTDIFVSTTDWVQEFAVGNATVDVTQFYQDFGKNSIDPGMYAASSYQGKLYALPHNSVGSIRPYHGLVYNVNKLNEIGLENPAALFNNGEWNWSKFEHYVLDAASKLEDDESVLSGKPAGLYYGMVNAAGVKLIDTVTLEVNFDHAYAVRAGNLVQELYQTDKVWGGNHWDAQNPSFNDQLSIFQVAEYWFLKDDGRFADDMWGEGDTLFGWVPFPHPDTVAKEETRVSYQGGAIYQMATGREWNHAEYGVTYEDVYRAFTEMMVTTAANLLEGVDGEEEILMRRAAAAKIDDPAGVNAIIFFKDDKVIFDPFYTVINSGSAGGAGPMLDAIARDNQDYFSVVDQYRPAFEAALLDLYGG